MRDFRKITRASFSSLLAAGMLSSTVVEAREEVRLPTESEFRKTILEYQEALGVNLSHVRVFYNEPRLSHRGPVGAVRMLGLNKCGIIVNEKDFFVGSVLSFFKSAPSQDIARKFLVAHEITHCLFSREDSLANLAAIGIKPKNDGHGQEIIADLVASAFVIKHGADPKQLGNWLNEERSNHLFGSNYNTAKFINSKNVAAVEHGITSRSGGFSFYAQKALFKTAASVAQRDESIKEGQDLSSTADNLDAQDGDPIKNSESVGVSQMDSISKVPGNGFMAP